MPIFLCPTEPHFPLFKSGSRPALGVRKVVSFASMGRRGRDRGLMGGVMQVGERFLMGEGMFDLKTGAASGEKTSYGSRRQLYRNHSSW